MFRIIKNKKGGLFGGKKYPPDQFDEDKINRGVTRAAIIGSFSDSIGKVIGRRLEGKGNRLSLDWIMGTILKPLKWFATFIVTHLARVAQVGVAIMIALAVWAYVVPPTIVWAAGEEINSVWEAVPWMGNKIKDLITKAAERADIINKRAQYELVGKFVEGEEGEDKTKYGIYLTSNDLMPSSNNMYPPDTDIIVRAYPRAEILGGDSIADIYCEIEDGILKEIIPHNRIPIKNLPKSTIICKFYPLPVGNIPKKDVTFTISYPFTESISLPVSVMDSSLYDRKFEEIRREQGGDSVAIQNALAKSVKVDYKQLAEGKITPVEIGAKVSGYQPVRTGGEYDFATLDVTVSNIGEGEISEIISIKINTGEQGLRLSPIDVDFIASGSNYVVDKEDLKYSGDVGDFKTFIFGLDTNSFALISGEEVTSTRITVEVTYVYNVSAKTEVFVPTCKFYSEHCIVEENEEGVV